jgi:hypothetical protein
MYMQAAAAAAASMGDFGATTDGAAPNAMPSAKEALSLSDVLLAEQASHPPGLIAQPATSVGDTVESQDERTPSRKGKGRGAPIELNLADMMLTDSSIFQHHTPHMIDGEIAPLMMSPPSTPSMFNVNAPSFTPQGLGPSTGSLLAATAEDAEDRESSDPLPGPVPVDLFESFVGSLSSALANTTLGEHKEEKACFVDGRGFITPSGSETKLGSDSSLNQSPLACHNLAFECESENGMHCSSPLKATSQLLLTDLLPAADPRLPPPAPKEPPAIAGLLTSLAPPAPPPLPPSGTSEATATPPCSEYRAGSENTDKEETPIELNLADMIDADTLLSRHSLQDVCAPFPSTSTFRADAPSFVPQGGDACTGVTALSTLGDGLNGDHLPRAPPGLEHMVTPESFCDTAQGDHDLPRCTTLPESPFAADLADGPRASIVVSRNQMLLVRHDLNGMLGFASNANALSARYVGTDGEVESADSISEKSFCEEEFLSRFDSRSRQSRQGPCKDLPSPLPLQGDVVPKDVQSGGGKGEHRGRIRANANAARAAAAASLGSGGL